MGADATTREVVDILLAPEGNLVQEVLLEEVAGIIDVLGRDALASSLADLEQTSLGRAAPFLYVYICIYI